MYPRNFLCLHKENVFASIGRWRCTLRRSSVAWRWGCLWALGLAWGAPCACPHWQQKQSFFINNLYINPYLVEPQPIRIITVAVLIIHYVAFCSCIIHHHHQHGHGHDHVHQLVAASSSPALAAQWSASRMLHDCQTRLDGSVVHGKQHMAHLHGRFGIAI